MNIKKWCLWWLFLLASAPLVADLRQSTSVSRLDLIGSAQLAGLMTMEVDGADFSAASQAEPIYIRLLLGHNVALSDTRVDLN